MASTDEKIKQIIVEQLGLDEAEVTANASLYRRPWGRLT